MTGATGFVGSQVVRSIVSDGHQPFCLVRPNSNLWRLEGFRASLRLVECELMDQAETRTCMSSVRPDMCVHCAWYVDPGEYWNSIRNLDWLCASIFLARTLAEFGCRRFVGIGTCAEYAAVRRAASEQDPTLPSTPYVASKIALSLALEQLARITDMEVAWARVFYLYGPFEPESRLVPSVILALLEERVADLTEGRQVRDFLHVEDAGSAIWAVGKSGHVGPVNVGSGEPVAIRELVTTLGNILGRPDLLRFGAISRMESVADSVYADISLLQRATSWQRRYALEDGLRQSVEWWKSHKGITGLVSSAES